MLLLERMMSESEMGFVRVLKKTRVFLVGLVREKVIPMMQFPSIWFGSR